MTHNMFCVTFIICHIKYYNHKKNDKNNNKNDNSMRK